MTGQEAVASDGAPAPGVARHGTPRSILLNVKAVRSVLVPPSSGPLPRAPAAAALAAAHPHAGPLPRAPAAAALAAAHPRAPPSTRRRKGIVFVTRTAP
jgi:hypothetical protein